MALQHTISPHDTLVAIAAKYNIHLALLLSSNPQLRARPDVLSVGQALNIPPSTTHPLLLKQGVSTVQACAKKETDVSSHAFLLGTGQLTFDAEGSEVRGKRFSRRPHVPNSTSGVIIGRGYVLKNRSEQDIYYDLLVCGVDADVSRKLAGCRHLVGTKARKFLRDMGYHQLEISAQAQKKLFILTYAECEGAIQAICYRPDVIAKYGHADWQVLPQVMRDITVDLDFCGEYTAATRERIQPALVSANPKDLLLVMSDQYYWLELRNVPADRFRRWREYLCKYLSAKQPEMAVPA